MNTTASIDLLAERAVRCAEQAQASLAELVGLLAQLNDEQRAAQPVPHERGEVSTSGSRLTSQERRVLTLMAAGLPNRKIAERLELSEKTVKNYVHGVLMKLNVTTRTEAASKALSELLVDAAECRRVRLTGTTGDLVPAPRGS